MQKLDIKPLSQNKAWTGRRHRSADYNTFRKHLFHLLPSIKLPKKTPLYIRLEFGVSNRGADMSNCVKCFEDVLSLKTGIDDKWNYEMHLKKIIVPKGKEYISFDIATMNEGSDTNLKLI